MEEIQQTEENILTASNDKSEKIIFSSDSHYLAHSSGDIKIWSMQNQNLLYHIGYQGKRSNCVAFSHDNNYLAIGFEQTVTVWDMETGKWLDTYSGHSDDIIEVFFDSINKRLVSISQDCTMRFWKNILWETEQPNKKNKISIDMAILSPDGNILALTEEGSVSLWLVKMWLQLCSFEVDKWRITSIGFSPNNQYLAMAGDHSSTVFLLCIPEFLVSKKILMSAFYGDYHHEKGKEAVENFKQYIYKNYGNVNSSPGYMIKNIVLSDTRLGAANSDGSLHVWDLTNINQENYICFCYSSNHTDVIYKPLLSSEGRYGYGHGLDRADSIKVIVSQDGYQFVLAKSFASLLGFIYCRTNLVVYIDPKNGIVDEIFNEKIEKESEKNLLTDIVFIPTNRYLAIAQNKLIKFIHADINEVLDFLEGHENEVICLALSPNHQYLASGSIDKTVRLWKIASMQCVSVLKGFKSGVSSISWSPYKKNSNLFFLTRSSDKVARYWEVVERDSSVHIVLCWASDQTYLVADNAKLSQTTGLTTDDVTLLNQQGATGKPASVKQITVIGSRYNMFPSLPSNQLISEEDDEQSKFIIG